MQGAILAAGRGERLRSPQADLPKPLVALAGRPLLWRQADSLRAAGAQSVVAVINSETAAAASKLRLALPQGLALVVRDTQNSLETWLELGNHLAPGWFVAATVDAVLARAEMARFVTQAQAQVQQRPALAGVLGVVNWRGDSRPLFVSVGQEGIVTAIGAQAAMVTAGIYFFSTRIFEYRNRAAGMGALRQFLAALIDWRELIGTVQVHNVIDVDETADLAAARRMVAAFDEE
ncbi:MAG TPA: NTP transferase domain-containing protein [Candidatus Binataceae bacterium]|nr:NTP transferase domain-containing protein [Candidatus Binataceae bacterium]